MNAHEASNTSIIIPLITETIHCLWFLTLTTYYPMKLLKPTLSVIVLATVGFFGYKAFVKKSENEKEIVGSIRIEKEGTRLTELAPLAKITFADAAKAAEAAVPGSIVKGKLESEDHYLIYSFKIISANKEWSEVSIDAGDAKVLEIEKGD